MSVYYQHDVLLQQNSVFWSTYKENNTKFCETVNKTFLPLFMEIYNMNNSATEELRDEACDLAEYINVLAIILVIIQI